MKNPVLSLTVAAFAGCFGGILSTQFFWPESAVARSSKTVTAERFDLVDSLGVRRASLEISGKTDRFTYFWMADNAEEKRLVFTVDSNKRVPKINFYKNGTNIGSVLTDRQGSKVSDRASKVERIHLEKLLKGLSSLTPTETKAEITYSDLRVILQQQQIIMDKLDELAGYH